MKNVLLSRDNFRNMVFERDNHICVIPECNKYAVDAHHIIERRLWQDTSEFGGYFLCNGASLCEEHHIAAEKNFYPPQYLWNILKIDNPIRPKLFKSNVDYNKWGIEFKMPNRYRIKYPTTPYLPFSPQWQSPESAKDDNAYLENIDCFLNAPIIITIKMDGSNVQMTKELIAARNGTVADHKSFDYLKSLHAQKYSYLIPDDIEVFGEWLYAKHSIHYTEKLSLPNYLQIFSIYNMKQRMWGSWNDVKNMSNILNVPTVPIIKEEIYKKDWELIRDVSNIAKDVIKQGHEGVVIRINYPFHYEQFSDHIAKYVRPNHVQTDDHWSAQSITRNFCKEENLKCQKPTV